MLSKQKKGRDNFYINERLFDLMMNAFHYEPMEVRRNITDRIFQNTMSSLMLWNRCVTCPLLFPASRFRMIIWGCPEDAVIELLQRNFFTWEIGKIPFWRIRCPQWRKIWFKDSLDSVETIDMESPCGAISYIWTQQTLVLPANVHCQPLAYSTTS